MTTTDKLIAKLKEYIEFSDWFVYGLTKQQKAEKGKFLTEIASLEQELAEQPKMSAEEILNKYGCPPIPFDENITMYYPAILNAMEAYAQQQQPEIEHGIPFKCPECGEMIQYGLSDEGMKLFFNSRLFKQKGE